MMRVVMVRYTVKPDRVAENEELVRAVYEELAQSKPEGFRYATFKLDDGADFMHVAAVACGAESPLGRTAAFARFQEGIATRCEQAPQVTELELVGSYPPLARHDPLVPANPASSPIASRQPIRGRVGG